LERSFAVKRFFGDITRPLLQAVRRLKAEPPIPGPFYHDFERLGLHNTQLPGIFAPNQQAKEPIVTAYILYAIAKLRNRGVTPISFVELFAADAYYAMFARKFGADSALAVDSDRDGYFDQARTVRVLLGLDVELLCGRVQDVPPERRFSIVANTGGLYHVDDPVETLKQSVRMAEHYLIVQNVVSLATESDSYFERPAPGWNWGNRFSRQSFDKTIRELRLRVADAEFNILAGNERPEDRGSVYYLIETGG
jgi:hypothetical protein